MRWRSRLTAFIICFVIGFVAAALVAGLRSLFRSKSERSATTATIQSPCEACDYFNHPEDVLAALKSPEVNLRREMFSRIFLRPDIATVYYDYQRDLNFPERADRARLQYVQLDNSPEPEALLTFVRFEHPVALFFKQQPCGWRLVTALSSWLRFEDYAYENWLSLPEAIEPGIHQLLVRESHGDSTSYIRKARLLRLTGDALTQIAEIDEEVMEPVSDYDGSDWMDIKLHRVNRFNFLNGRPGERATIIGDVTSEIIRLKGSAPQYSYWLETDGSWHTRLSNWNRRVATRMKLIDVSHTVLRWNSQEGRFIKLSKT